MVELAFLPRAAPAKGIGEPDPPLAVDGQVIGPVVTAPLQAVGQRRHRAIRIEAGDAVVAALAPVEAALGIEHQSVGALCPGAELRTRAGLWVIPHDAVARNMCEQECLAVPSRALSGAPIGASDQFEGPIAHVLPSQTRLNIDINASCESRYTKL